MEGFYHGPMTVGTHEEGLCPVIIIAQREIGRVFKARSISDPVCQTPPIEKPGAEIDHGNVGGIWVRIHCVGKRRWFGIFTGIRRPRLSQHQGQDMLSKSRTYVGRQWS